MKNVRVLIADDNPQILRFLSNLLSDDFYIVGTVSDRKALIAAAMDLLPHIIITDIDMPTMTGLDAVRRLEALMPDIKVIVLTGHEEPEFVAVARAAGASGFISKTEGVDLRIRTKELIQNLLRTPDPPIVIRLPISRCSPTVVSEDGPR